MMHIATLVSVLDQPQLAAEHLHEWGLRDVARGQQILAELAESGLTLELLRGLCEQLGEHLPHAKDPDAALTALHRYLSAVRSPLAFASLLERDAEALPMLLAALSLGPLWSELLIADAEAFDLLRQADGRPLAREALLDDVQAEISSLADERQIVRTIGRLRGRHQLRIACGERRGWPIETAMEQLSLLAEAIVSATFRAALRKASEVRPLPARLGPHGPPACVIAIGRLGAGEQDYRAPLELLVVHDAATEDAATFQIVREHFDRAAKLLVRYLSDASCGLPAYEVSLLPLPDGDRAAQAHSVHDAALGFESFGRTWHRQALLKARAIAGDSPLGETLLTRLQSWLFRRYLSPPDETGIQALKRRIVMEATLHQDDWHSPRLARGGLRDLEATVQLLQLLSGGDEPAVRQRGTLAAIAGLAQAGALAPEEQKTLAESYVHLRRIEHRLQVAFPATDAALIADLPQWESRSWQVLRKLLDSAFEWEPPSPREVDLLLDPAPPAEEVRAALAPFGFARPTEALATLNSLAVEQVPFLSTRRCRHCLASILPRLLTEISATPDPDQTLGNIAVVGDSLGGKGVLWDLFRFNPPSLSLYVRLCAASPYLSEILTANPGMIDELVDSLQLDKLPRLDELQATLDELCRGAADTLAVLHDFKNAQHLRIGVRDILGKEDVDRTHAALADVAEVCLGHVVKLEYGKLMDKFGRPTLGPGPFEGQQCRLAIIAFGKLGGREPNYHSSLDLLFLYEGEGITRPGSRSRQNQRTANNHFFTQLAQRVIKVLSEHSPQGRLYAVEPSLRPIGVGGALAMPLADFAQHFASGAAPLWQCQALCQARPVFGDAPLQDSARRLIAQLLVERPAQPADRQELRRWRLQLEQGASPQNLKRGPGGTLDVEYLVQWLQLRTAAAHPGVLSPNTQSAIPLLAAAGALSPEQAEQLAAGYRFLRRVESGLRLLNTSARHDLPADAAVLGQLALLVGHSNPAKLREQCLAHMAANRLLFDELTAN